MNSSCLWANRAQRSLPTLPIMFSSHSMSQSVNKMVLASFKSMGVTPQGKLKFALKIACFVDDFTLRSLDFEWFSSVNVNFRLQNDAHTLPFSRACVLRKMVAYELQRTSLERSTWRKPPNFSKSWSGIYTNRLDFHPNWTSTRAFSSELSAVWHSKHF